MEGTSLLKSPLAKPDDPRTSTPKSSRGVPKNPAREGRSKNTFTLLSSDISVVVPENDDDAERRELSKSRLSSSHGPASHRGRRAISFLNESQKKEHYKLCMKLTSENKINEKNAFELHLIDYMHDLVKCSSKSPNLVVASMTLLASTKIYAIRVDTIHAKAQKVADVLHGVASSNRRSEKSEGIEKHSAESEAPSTDASHIVVNCGRSGKSKSNRIAISTQDIDGILELNEDPHVNYQYISGFFEEGDVRAMMGTFSVADDSNKLLVPGEKHCEHLKHPAGCMTPVEVPRHLRDLTKRLTRKTKLIGALGRYSLFDFRWPLDAGDVLPQNSLISRNADEIRRKLGLQPHEEMQKLTARRHDDKCTHKTHSLKFWEAPSTIADLNRSDLQRNGYDGVHWIPPSAEKPCISSISATSSLRYIPSGNKNLEALSKAILFGHEALLQKRSMNSTRRASGMPVQRRREKTTTFSFESPEPLIISKRLRQARRPICIAEQTCQEWSKDTSNTLPKKSHDPRELTRLFLKPNFVLAGRSSVLTREGPIDRNSCGTSEQSEPREYSDGSEYAGKNYDKTVSLVPSPSRIEYDVLTRYARMPKFVNQSEVKRLVWSAVREAMHREPGEQDRVIDFCEMYRQLKHLHSEFNADDVGIPATFTSLLHVASENALRVENSKDLKKLFISSDKLMTADES